MIQTFCVHALKMEINNCDKIELLVKKAKNPMTIYKREPIQYHNWY